MVQLGFSLVAAYYGHDKRRVPMLRSIAIASVAALTVATVAAPRTVDVKVIDVEPIVQRVDATAPRERCWIETRRHRVEREPGAPLLGALFGAAVGHSIGRKRGERHAGAVVGALIGAAYANEEQRRLVRRGHRVRQEVCEVVDAETSREEVAGYWVTYRYAGHTHRLRMPHHPGKTLRIHVMAPPAA